MRSTCPLRRHVPLALAVGEAAHAHDPTAGRFRRIECPVEEGRSPRPISSLTSGAGENRSKLSRPRAAEPVVLYFYPKDDTPGCTAQACGIRDAWGEFQRAGAVVLGVSPDDEASHVKFKEKYELPFTLLADTDHRTADDYGVWVEKNYAGKTYMGVERSTFVIDADGQRREGAAQGEARRRTPTTGARRASEQPELLSTARTLRMPTRMWRSWTTRQRVRSVCPWGVEVGAWLLIRNSETTSLIHQQDERWPPSLSPSEVLRERSRIRPPKHEVVVRRSRAGRWEIARRGGGGSGTSSRPRSRARRADREEGARPARSAGATASSRTARGRPAALGARAARRCPASPAYPSVSYRPHRPRPAAIGAPELWGPGWRKPARG